MARSHAAEVELHAVVVTVTRGTPRVLTLRRDGEDRLPSGPLVPEQDRTLELGLRRWLQEQAGLEVGYVEQLYTLGNRYRDPRERTSGVRVLSVAYLTLVHEQAAPRAEAIWRDWYEFFPWEDWRSRRPPVIQERIAPALLRWVKEGRDPLLRRQRRERREDGPHLGHHVLVLEPVLVAGTTITTASSLASFCIASVLGPGIGSARSKRSLFCPLHK